MEKRVLTAFSLLVFSCAVLICGVWFLYVKTIISMVVLAVMMVALFVWYSYCAKIVTLPEGYNIFQALMFYKSCVKTGINSLDDAKKNQDLLKDILDEQGITDVSDMEALWKLYCDGQEVNSFISTKQNIDIEESEDCNE